MEKLGDAWPRDSRCKEENLESITTIIVGLLAKLVNGTGSTALGISIAI